MFRIRSGQSSGFTPPALVQGPFVSKSWNHLSFHNSFRPIFRTDQSRKTPFKKSSWRLTQKGHVAKLTDKSAQGGLLAERGPPQGHAESRTTGMLALLPREKMSTPRDHADMGMAARVLWKRGWNRNRFSP